MRLLWLAEVLRDAGLTVVEHDGWRERGWEPWEPRYGIVHATAAPRTQSDADQVRIVRDGHSALNGPIANCCVDRTSRWHVLASGRCNTALTGWAGPADGLGNTYLLGVEACNNNNRPGEPPEPWPDGQYQAYARGWAAICRRMGWPASRCVGHKEHQPGDKSDPTFNMATFRSRVAAYMEDDMALTTEDLEKISHAVWARVNPSAEQTYSEILRGTARRVEVAELRALVAGLAGEDVAAAARATIREEFALLGPALAAELDGVSVEQITEALGRLRLVADQ